MRSGFAVEVRGRFRRWSVIDTHATLGNAEHQARQLRRRGYHVRIKPFRTKVAA